MIGKIAVSAATFAIDKPYSYAIPETMSLAPGQRVMVPFGRGNRRCISANRENDVYFGSRGGGMPERYPYFAIHRDAKSSASFSFSGSLSP